MPIRFRCEHCKQLLGIARRKAGMEVACPKCRRQVLVPAGDVQEVAASQPSPPVFERSEFEAYLRDLEVGPARPRLAPPPAPMPLPSFPPPVAETSGEPSLMPFPSAALPGPDYANGIFLSPTWATVLTVVVILLLALAFSAGLLVGRLL